MASQDIDPHEQERNTTAHPASAEETSTSALPRYQHPFPFTIVPNSFLDDFLPRLSPTAQSVMLVFYRLTLGWHRSNTFISLNELRQRTGIASDATLTRALRELLAVGLISVSEQRGLRGLKGYCLTPAALSSTESVELSSAQPLHQALQGHAATDDPLPSATESVGLHQGQTPHNVKKLHIVAENPTPSPTDSVEEPLQKLKQYPYRNCRSTSTESVEVNASQPSLGAVPQESKERVKKGKDRSKEIVRYERHQEMQNAIQKETPNKNTRSAEDPLRAEPDQPAASQEPDAAAAQRGNERRSASRRRAPARLRDPLEAQQPSSAASPGRQAPGESTGVRLRPPPGQAPSAAGAEAAEVAARRQRLLALQRELAQLKKTPSMQLLARQRIPRLEAEIQQLVAALQASA